MSASKAVSQVGDLSSERRNAPRARACVCASRERARCVDEPGVERVRLDEERARSQTRSLEYYNYVFLDSTENWTEDKWRPCEI